MTGALLGAASQGILWGIMVLGVFITYKLLDLSLIHILLTSRVRYSEIDESGALSPLSLINYLQDCSTFHAEDVGAGICLLYTSRCV